MTLTPEELSEQLRAAAGNNLRSVVLYGSAAAGDHVAGKSNFNILAVLNKLGMEELTSITKVAARWAKDGNPPPLLFTRDRLRASADVFPIELADIRDTRRILFGEDPLADTVINPAHLRAELEHELKGKLLQLRERFLLTEGKEDKVRELLMNSLSTFLVLFRAALRLHGGTPPAKKLEALAELRKRVEFDDEVFRLIDEMRQGKKDKGLDALGLFARYLKSVETVVDAVDAWVGRTN